MSLFLPEKCLTSHDKFIREQLYWCLVFVAYSLLHLDCLPPSPTKGSLPVKTIGEACRQQAQALMQALILYAHERLQLGQRAEDLFGSLFAKQQTGLARC